MTAADQHIGPNAREAEYWNSPATRAWANRHEPIDALFTGLTQVAFDHAAPQYGEHVLDIGCGSGTTVLELAARVGSRGHVLGADIAQASVERARARIAASGLANAKVILADVSTHAFAPKQFDLVFSRFGVMFFSDPTATFMRLRAAMKPNGRLTLTVFRAADRNPWATAPIASVRHLLPPVASPRPEDPGQFSWADPARIQRILDGAGFRDVSLTPHHPAMRLAEPGGAEQAVQFAMSVGPAVRATSGASDAVREAVRAGLHAFFQQLDGPQGIVLPGAIWIVKARA
jgi:ubiquinone/menaquinone biosynthesis C-methylase UbiE